MKKISIFNRRELIITYDLKEQSDVREKLSRNNINYIIRFAMYTPNLNRCTAEYKIYVHRDDYDIAKKIITQRNSSDIPKQN